MVKMKEKINIHFYMSPLKNQTRILKELDSLGRLNIFDRLVFSGLSYGEPNVNYSGFNQINLNTKSPSSRLAKVVLYLKYLLHAVMLIVRTAKNAKVTLSLHSAYLLPLGFVRYLLGNVDAIIYLPHELESQKNGISSIGSFVTSILERYFLKRVKFVVYVSNSIQRWYLVKYGEHPSKVIFNTPLFKQRNTSERSNYFRDFFQISPERRIFLYQGLFAKNRGIELILTAFSMSETTDHVVFMGSGPLEPLIAEYARKLTNIHIHPSVDPQDIFNYTSSADFGLSLIEPVFLSYEMCMPNKIFEYIYSGIPVIVSDTKDQDEFVSAHNLGYVLREMSSAGLSQMIGNIDERQIDVFKIHVNKYRMNNPLDSYSKQYLEVYT